MANFVIKLVEPVYSVSERPTKMASPIVSYSGSAKSSPSTAVRGSFPGAIANPNTAVIVIVSLPAGFDKSDALSESS